MADYSFYTALYQGNRIPEKHFGRCMRRAKEALALLGRKFRVTGGTEERKLALCAMAEAVYDARYQGVSAATVGSVSVRYLDGKDRQLWRELYAAARIYLDIYRGVSQ